MSTTQQHAGPLDGFYAWQDNLKGVYFGPGSLKTALPKLLDTLGAKKALIVTGKSLYTKTDIIKGVESILQSRSAYGATFHDIGEHSPIAGIKAGVQAFKDVQADIIVAVGGGSPVDAAKAILWNVQQETGGAFYRQISVPTTLSAAEYTMGAGYTNAEGHKVVVASTELAPAGIILDAELTLATPERLWLSTGMRALDHAVENLYRAGVPEPMRVMCYSAIADLFRYLPESKANPNDVGIRQKLQIASWKSLWPIKMESFVALGLSHGLGHKLGAAYHIPHGITSCLTLSPVVALKAELASESDKDHLAAALFYLRIPSTGSVDGDVLKLSSEIGRLVNELGLKSDLKTLGVPREDLPVIAGGALGGQDKPEFGRVVKLLEGLYS